VKKTSFRRSSSGNRADDRGQPDDEGSRSNNGAIPIRSRAAKCLLALGRQDEALRYVEQAWDGTALPDPKISPRPIDVPCSPGDIAMRTGDFPKAAHHYQIVPQILKSRTLHLTRT
jgi:hypothetical protein